MDINKELADAIAEIKDNLVSAAEEQVTAEIAFQLSQVDLKKTVESIVKHTVEQIIKVRKFPDDSINYKSVDFTGAKLTGNIIKGGLIEEFNSTGIEDQASDIKVTIMDEYTVLENCLLALEADIKGNVNVEGNLVVKGKIENKQLLDDLVTETSKQVKASLDKDLFEGYAEIVANKITEEGIDLKKVLNEGRTLVKGNQIGYHITDSNLQRVGRLKDLQTTGENLLSETLYVANKRVGINTLDPSSALSIWDEEVEIVNEKKQKDVGYIGTKRKQVLVLGSNSNDNLVLHDNGSVTIDKLNIGRMPMSSTNKTPQHEASKGVILWNENVEMGAPIGWVSLGGAKWASFGWIE